MRIPRIYQSSDLKENLNILLDKSACNHTIKVLRLNVGDKIQLFNGDSYYYQAQIDSISSNSVTVTILSKHTVSNESPLNIHLYQGVSRGDKMDLTLQKGVELGINTFTPIISERCGVKLDEKRWLKKLEHWRKVIISACEQSGRNLIPKVNPVLSWYMALNQLESKAYFLDPHATKSFRELDKPDKKNELQLWVGPEGGFSENEILQIKQQGTQPIYLGPRILRTEKAALAAVSALNALWGDF